MEKIKTALGLHPDASDEAVLEAVTALIASGNDVARLKTAIADLKTERAQRVINRLPFKLTLDSELAIQGALANDFEGTLDLFAATRHPLAAAISAAARPERKSRRG